MTRYRSKPVEIEATQWLKDGDHPAVEVFFYADGEGRSVRGAQGPSRVKSGDWVITEPRGDGFYPCNPEVFATKYEAI